MRLSLFMLFYATTAAAVCAWLFRSLDGTACSLVVFAAAVVWFVGVGAVLAIYRNPDRPSRTTLGLVESLIVIAIIGLLLAFGL